MTDTCKLALEDGTILTGSSVGTSGTHTGEVVFNTAMTGYQEVLTDPSYCGQIVTMTFPLIGNYGVNPFDDESAGPRLAGFVVKELPRRPSHHLSAESFCEVLRRHGIVGLAGVDTRALTRRIRRHGALRGVLSTEIRDDLELVRRARAAPSMEGANLVARVSPDSTSPWTQPLAEPNPTDAPLRDNDCHLVAVDCGIKHNILRCLVSAGCRLTAAPAHSTPDLIRGLHPDGLVVGNGPGDPAAVVETVQLLREWLGRLPILGICLGHQMLALALGAKTYKLRFGHHGANVPVLNVPAGRVEITSQNHGFAVERESLEAIGGRVTHVNLNDQSVEGFLHADRQALAVQFHPEAGPGPRDAAYLISRFVQAVKNRIPIAPAMLQ